MLLLGKLRRKLPSPRLGLHQFAAALAHNLGRRLRRLVLLKRRRTQVVFVDQLLKFELRKQVIQCAAFGRLN